MDKSPDVIILNSTSILPHEDEVRLPKYHTISSPKGQHNGTAILIKNTIKYKILEGFVDPYFLAIKTYSKDGEVILCTHYCPFKKANVNSHLPIPDLNKVLNQNTPLFFLGDLNAKHKAYGHSYSNSRGKLIENFRAKRKDFNYLGPNFNTYMSGKRTSKPDIIFSNSRAAIFNTHIEGGPLLTSDHRLITLQISTSPIQVSCPPIYDHKQANIDLYKEILEKFTIPDHTGQPYHILDEWWAKVADAIIQAAKASRPFKTTLTYINAITPSHSTKVISQAYINISNFLFNQPNPSLQRHANILLKKLRQSWGEDIQNYNIHLTEKAASAYKKDPKLFFSLIDRFRGNFSTPTTNLEHNGVHYRQPEEVLNVFEEVWKSIHFPNPVAPASDAEEMAERVSGWCDQNSHLINPHPTIDLNNLDDNNNLIARINDIDMEYAISRFKKKAPGETGIDKEMIKHLPSRFIKQLRNLYNATLSCGYMPKPFKSAITVLIPKINNAKNPKDYRPIALLDALAKIYETLIYRRLKWHLEENGSLDQNQFGFRPDRSTHHTLNILLNYINTNVRRGRNTILICKDVQKAFDTVWHEGFVQP